MDIPDRTVKCLSANFRKLVQLEHELQAEFKSTEIRFVVRERKAKTVMMDVFVVRSEDDPDNKVVDFVHHFILGYVAASNQIHLHSNL